MVHKPKQQGQQSQGQVLGVPNVDPQTAILVRVGLVEVRACFWGYMIKSHAFYRVFWLEFRRAKRTNFLKDVGMFSVKPKRHPGAVTTALCVCAREDVSSVAGTMCACATKNICSVA